MQQDNTSPSKGQEKVQNQKTSSEIIVESNQNQQGLSSSQALPNNNITIPKKQLLAMNKKLNKLKTQNQNYKKELNKKGEQKRKNQTFVQGLQQTIKQLQKMVDQSTKNQNKIKRESQTIRQIFKVQKDMNNNYQRQVQQLRNISSQYFLLKQQVTKLETECRTLRQAKEQYPLTITKIQKQNIQIINYKQKLQEKDNEIKKLQTIIEKIEKKNNSITQEKNETERKFQAIQCQKLQLLGQIDVLSAEIEDQRTEKQLQQRKYLNEIKLLKTSLHQEHQKLILTEIQLSQAQKRRKKSIDIQKTSLSKLTKQDLFNLIQQSEMKYATLQLALNQLSKQHQILNIKAKDQEKAIFSISRQLLKANPNLDQSQGMDYVEKDIILIGKQRKDDWGQIVQKVMLQNLRLKYSVTQLGEQYNLRIRQQKK